MRTLLFLPQHLPATMHVPESSPQRIYLAVLIRDIKTLACHEITQKWKQTPQNSDLYLFSPTIWVHVLSYFYNLKKSLYIHIKLLLIQKLLINLIMYLRCSLWNKNKAKIIWNMCFIFGKLLLHLKYSNCHFFSVILLLWKFWPPELNSPNEWVFLSWSWNTWNLNRKTKLYTFT